MTRAEERLYIAGHRGARAISPESWRAFIEFALLEGATEAPAPWGGNDKVLRFGAPETAPEAPLAISSPAPEQAAASPPAWLFAPAPAESRRRAASAPVERSGGGRSGARGPIGAVAAARPGAGRGPARPSPAAIPAGPAARGRGARPPCAISPRRALRPRGPKSSPAPCSPFSMIRALRRCSARTRSPRRGSPRGTTAGRRTSSLSPAPSTASRKRRTAIWLADYKTGAPRAESRPVYAAQLALYRAAVAQLYPGQPVRCFLIHASGPVVTELEAAELDAAKSASHERRHERRHGANMSAALRESRGSN